MVSWRRRRRTLLVVARSVGVLIVLLSAVEVVLKAESVEEFADVRLNVAYWLPRHLMLGATRASSAIDRLDAMETNGLYCGAGPAAMPPDWGMWSQVERVTITDIGAVHLDMQGQRTAAVHD